MSKILIDLVELETALNKTETYAEMSGKNHAFVKGIRAAKKIALACKDTEIVQCKDCVNCIKEPNGELYCDVLAIGYEPLGSKKVTEDWFCADGERR